MPNVGRNLAKTTIPGAITNSQTTITVADGSVFEDPGGTGEFDALIEQGTAREIVRVTDRAGNDLTVERGVRSGTGGGAGQAFSAGATIREVWSREAIEMLIDQRIGANDIAYVERFTTLSVTATTAAAAQEVVSAGAVTYDGGPVEVEFFAPYVSVGNDGFCIFVLYDGATELGRLGQVHVIDASADAAQGGWPVRLTRKFTPSAGSHTYIVKAYRLTSDATVHAGVWGSDTLPPAFVRVRKLGTTVPVTVGAVPEVTALPGSPTDGQEILYRVDENTLWHLRYNADATAPYRWVVVSATALSAFVAAFESTSSSSFADLTTAGPSVTVPLAGIYDIDLTVQASNANSANNSIVAPKYGASEAADDDSAIGTGTLAATPSRIGARVTIAAAAQEVKLRYKSPGATSATFGRRRLRVSPVRLG